MAADGGAAVTVRMGKTDADLDIAVSLCRAFHEEGPYKALDFDPERLKRQMAQMYDYPLHFGLLIAERDGEPTGLLIAALSDLGGNAYGIGNSMLLYVLPAARNGRSALKLIQGLRKWALNRQAREIRFFVMSGIRLKTTDRLLRRMGFVMTGANYAAPVAPVPGELEAFEAVEGDSASGVEPPPLLFSGDGKRLD